jgi:thiol-disulfide isomerase/thioredoxin
MNLATKFDEGLGYHDFLERHGSDHDRSRWAAVHAQVALSDAQKALLGSFRREMKVLVMAGAWCGDCVNQCPIFEHFAAATDHIRLRFFDRDAHPDLAELLKTCGAARVPAVLFLSEDDQVCGRYGDRTLAKYRQMAANLGGAACPSGISAPGDSLLAQVTQDWLDEFERIQLMLRTSARLREKHGD